MRHRQTKLYLALYTIINATIAIIISFWSNSDVLGLLLITLYNFIAIQTSFSLLKNERFIKGPIFLIYLVQLIPLKALNHYQMLSLGPSISIFTPQHDSSNQFYSFLASWSFCEIKTTGIQMTNYRYGLNLAAITIILFILLIPAKSGSK